MSGLTLVSPKIDFCDSLECSVCAQLFKDPKQLSCGHTFCLECIDRMVEMTSNSWRKSISCPHCREVTLIPEFGLRTNFVVGDLVLKVKNLSIAPPGETKECTICQNVFNESEIAVCKTCSKFVKVYICSLCALKMHKNHDVELLSQIALEQQKVDVLSVVSQLYNVSKAYSDKNFSYSTHCSTAMNDIAELMLKKLTVFNNIISQLNDPTKIFLEKDLVAYIKQTSQISSMFNQIASKSACFLVLFNGFAEELKNMLIESSEVNVTEDEKLYDAIRNLGLPTLLLLNSQVDPQIIIKNTNPFAYDVKTPKRAQRKKYVKRKTGLII